MRVLPILPSVPLFIAYSCAAGGAPALLISEVLADPAAWPDAQGEFLELGHPGSDSARPQDVTVSVNGQALALGALALGPGASFLICRDSAAYARAGIACDRAWPGLSLPNGRTLEAAVAWTGGAFQATVPASRPGASWENTWDPSAGYAAFLPSRAARPGGDSATPGARNSRSVRPPGRDLALAAIAVSGGNAHVTVADRGASGPGPARVFVALDADWDGRAETLLDSARLDPAGPFPAQAVFRIPAGARGRLAAYLEPGDEDPGDDVLAAALEPGGAPLAFGACEPEGHGGGPEWVEIRNPSGAGRRIALSEARVDGMALGAKAGALDPGGRAFLTSDTAAFRARYGPLQAKVLRPEPWRSLRNSGDTLVLTLCGLPVDTLSWGAARAGTPEGGGGPGLTGGDGPGFPAEAGWTLSGRTAFPIAPLEVEVRAPAGADYVLRAFDLEGGVAREIGRGGPGRRVHLWDGRGAGGRPLPRGAYVLCLSFGDGRARKRAVVAGER
jgi:hypothetical protein